MISFDALIEELGKLMNLDLKPDEQGCCLILFPEGPSIQLEMEDSGKEVLMAVEVAKVGVGGFRERVLEAALKANGGGYPKDGFFGFNESFEELILFEKLPLKDLRPEEVEEKLQALLKKSAVWQQAIESGDLPSIEEGGALKRGGGPGGLFELHP